MKIAFFKSPTDFRDWLKKLRKHKAAWKFFEAQTGSYRKNVNWWILGAKREETRQKRLAELIEHSTNERYIPGYLRTKK